MLEYENDYHLPFDENFKDLKKICIYNLLSPKRIRVLSRSCFIKKNILMFADGAANEFCIIKNHQSI